MTAVGPAGCSLSAFVDEPLPGTAAHASGWLCLEVDAGWGRDISDGVALGRERTDAFLALAKAADLRPTFIRHPGRSRRTERRTVLIARCEPGNTWIEQLVVDDVEEVLAWNPLELNASGAPGLGGTPEEPHVLVCAHGKRDRCCAVLGRPVASSLAERFGESVWECSHTGGHRFAPSMIVLPTGYTYGRLGADASAAVVEAAAVGTVALQGLPGRSPLTQAEQVAEVAVRQMLSPGTPLPDDAVRAEAEPRDPYRVTVRADARTWQVQVRPQALPPRPTSSGGDPKPVTAVVVESMRPAAESDER